MYGSSFKERHKEWFKESLALMVKTTPWIVIAYCVVMMPPLALCLLADAAASHGFKLVSLIAVCGIIPIFLSIIAFGPVALAANTIMHRIDQGQKQDPITIFYFVMREKEMWISSLKADFKIVGPAIIMISITIISAIIVGYIMHDPLQAPPVPKVDTPAMFFWKAHPAVSYLETALCLFSATVIPYLILHEVLEKTTFNTFMFSNGYKNLDECQNDGIQARPKLYKYWFPYLAAPQLAIMIFGLFKMDDYPIAILIMSAIQFLIGLWSLHMAYIIGRDYYIGPPPKKQKQESFDKRMQTA